MRKLHTEDTWISTIIFKNSEITPPRKVLSLSGSYLLDGSEIL